MSSHKIAELARTLQKLKVENEDILKRIKVVPSHTVADDAVRLEVPYHIYSKIARHLDLKELESE